jgi:anti-sigma-K factor RskA
MPELHPHDDLGALAAGALDDAERQLVEAHLATCAGCRQELAEYRQVTHALAPSMMAERPPAGTWVAISARLERRDAAVAPEPEPTRISGWRSRGRVLVIGWAATAAALAGVIGWGTFEAVDTSTNSVQQLASSDTGYVVPLVGGSGASAGRLYISEDKTQGGLAVSGLPTTATGETYQLWFITHDQVWTPAGTFEVDAQGRGLVKVDLPGPIDSFDGVAVCTEPPPGSYSKWGEMVLSGPVYERQAGTD